MSDVKFEDYSVEVKNIINSRIKGVLHECAGEIVSATKQNSRVDTGQTKNSFRHVVKKSGSDYIAYMVSKHENAIWEEFGTGEYALKGNGRKGGWFYEDEKGEGHFTHGKTPSRAFWNAYTSMKAKVINRIQNALKGM